MKFNLPIHHASKNLIGGVLEEKGEILNGVWARKSIVKNNPDWVQYYWQCDKCGFVNSLLIRDCLYNPSLLPGKEKCDGVRPKFKRKWLSHCSGWTLNLLKIDKVEMED
jgi:hypothetical protein